MILSYEDGGRGFNLQWASLAFLTIVDNNEGVWIVKLQFLTGNLDIYAFGYFYLVRTAY